MFDLKAKLAAAGVVTKEQVDKVVAEQQEDRARAATRRASRSRGGKGKRRGRSPGPEVIDVASLKALNRGEAYAKIRTIVDRRRLDDKERTIPKADDEPFNFVTSAGKVRRLYVSAETAQSLRAGKSAISAFMSHHGLSHCVLPAEVALALAEIFPLWLRHLVGNEAAGRIDEPTSAPAPEDASVIEATSTA